MSDHERAVPWSAEEYIWVSGYKLVYTFNDEGKMMVRFPGGRVWDLKTLLKMQIIVQEPKKVRREELYV